MTNTARTSSHRRARQSVLVCAASLCCRTVTSWLSTSEAIGVHEHALNSQRPRLRNRVETGTVSANKGVRLDWR